MNDVARIEGGTPASAEGNVPHNIEAEQQLLGALLTDNDLYDRIASIVRAEDFHDPCHARIFELCAARVQKNALASPVTLKPFLEEDEALKALGGPAYLVTLAASAVAGYAVRDYARMIHDLAVRRTLMGLGRDVTAMAADMAADIPPDEQIVRAEAALYGLAEQGRSESGFQSFLSAVKQAVDVANAHYQREGDLAGVSMGLIDLDKKLQGLQFYRIKSKALPLIRH